MCFVENDAVSPKKYFFEFLKKIIIFIKLHQDYDKEFKQNI